MPERSQSRENGVRRRDIVGRVWVAGGDWWVIGVEEELGCRSGRKRRWEGEGIGGGGPAH